MDTLYDLLGALPRDDAEGLRTAFRRAVKGTHPDLNPGDPEAGQKFRQIIRAQEILLDGEQRAVYDHLLALAKLEAAEDVEHAAKHARAGKIHRVASWVMTLAGVSAVSIASLAVAALFWTSTEPVADTGLATDEPIAIDGPAPTQVVTVPEQPAPAPIASTEIPSPPPVAPVEASDSAPQPLGPPLDITPPATPPAPDRTRSFNRAFADISHAKHPEKGGHAAKKKGPDAAEGGARSTPRRTAANDLSRLESAPFIPRP
jgi:curved DNA-binding protein CbpA